ncbi:MAG TPA: hypothetical protein VK034_24080 [Enhygromyxa sp.]|nr:hypothetical protein [Enhygromyxa sp.]
MQLATILATILLATNPDLCADVYLDDNGEPYTDAAGQTLSRFCDWTGPDAPVLDLDVCCTISGDNARCSLPNRKGRCSTGSRAYYCEHGEATSTGAVVCYQRFLSACDLGFCGDVLPPGSGPLEDTLCCWGGTGVCTEIETAVDSVNCSTGGGYLTYCKQGAQNTDGTVDCFD